MHIVVAQAPSAFIGCWHHLRDIDGRPTNWFGYTCPKCGTTSLTVTGSTFPSQISPDGALTPDFICVNECCDYRAPLRLRGWTGVSRSISSPA